MTTGAIIAIVVVALIIIALLAFMLPRMRAKAQVQKRERELQNRRERAAEEQRSEANARERQASEAEQRARIAAKEAEAERAQAQLHEERAGLHERGMADHELIDDSERERFAGTSAMGGRNDRDGDGVDDRREGGGTLENDYQRGRHDEAVVENERPARFNREDDTAAESATERDARTRY
jgi:type II secretory pathway pseudopilin PulG